MAIETIGLRAELENLLSKEFAKMRGDVTGDMKKMQKSGDSLGSSLKKVAIGFASFAAARKAVGFMVDATMAASALEEATSKFETVFEGVGNKAESMADILQNSFLMSRRESVQYLSAMQDLLVPMGMAKDAASDMSFATVKLSADLASFNNLPTAQVMGDIQSAIVGNFETMKKYGVILNETVIRQKALDMGFKIGKGVIDANTKAQVAFQLMLDGSEAAIGDVARTSDSFANKLKDMTANWEDFTAGLGNYVVQSGPVGGIMEFFNTKLKQMAQNLQDVQDNSPDRVLSRLSDKFRELDKEFEKFKLEGSGVSLLTRILDPDFDMKLFNRYERRLASLKQAIKDQSAFVRAGADEGDDGTAGGTKTLTEAEKNKLKRQREIRKKALEREQRDKIDAIRKTQNLEHELGLITNEQFVEILGERVEMFKGSEEARELFALQTHEKVLGLFESEERSKQESLDRQKIAQDKADAEADMALERRAMRVQFLGEAIGAALASGVGKGSEGLKESFKAILVTTLSLIQRQVIAAQVSGLAQAAMGDFSAIARVAAVTALFEGSKAMIGSFQTGFGQTRRVPGRPGQGRLGIVHGEEELSRPLTTNNFNNQKSNTFILPASGSTNKEDLRDVLLSMVRDGYLNDFKIELEEVA